MTPKRIIINASDVASLVGYNPYTSKEQTILKVLSRNPFLSGNKDIKIYSSAVEEKLSTLTQEEQKTFSDILTKCKDSLQKSIEENQEEQSKKIIKDLISSTPTLAFLEKDIEKDVRIKRGTEREKDALNKLEDVSSRNNILHTLYIGNNVWIHGKIDGLTKDGTIVETKNRRSRFFEGIPLYEKVQMEIYMEMLGKTECIHVQNFNGEQKQVIYKKNPSLFEDCKEKVLIEIDLLCKSENYSQI